MGRAAAARRGWGSYTRRQNICKPASSGLSRLTASSSSQGRLVAPRTTTRSELPATPSNWPGGGEKGHTQGMEGESGVWGQGSRGPGRASQCCRAGRRRPARLSRTRWPCRQPRAARETPSSRAGCARSRLSLATPGECARLAGRRLGRQRHAACPRRQHPPARRGSTHLHQELSLQAPTGLVLRRRPLRQDAVDLVCGWGGQGGGCAWGGRERARPVNWGASQSRSATASACWAAVQANGRPALAELAAHQ